DRGVNPGALCAQDGAADSAGYAGGRHFRVPFQVASRQGESGWWRRRRRAQATTADTGQDSQVEYDPHYSAPFGAPSEPEAAFRANSFGSAGTEDSKSQRSEFRRSA